MTNRSVQHECVQRAMPDLDELMKLAEDCTKEQVREQEITRIRKIDTRQDKRDPERTKRIMQSPLRRRWLQRLNIDETYRSPSLFTWRC